MKTSLRVSSLTCLVGFLISGTASADPYQAIKDKFRCREPNVLCVDACTGDILARSNVANGVFMNTDADATIQVRVVGDCSDNGVSYESTVSYRKRRDRLTKAPVQPTPVAATPTPGAPPQKNQTASFSIALDGDDSTFVADVEIKRVPLPVGGGGASALALPQLNAASPLPRANWSTAHAAFRLVHGRYYVDFGVGAAVVPRGKQSITATPYRGDSGDLRLTTETSTPLTPLFSAFIYPFGHRRGTFSPFDSWGAHILSDLFVVQVATELSREDILRTVYLGAGLEPVSGLNVTLGAALVPISVYRSGAQAGNATTDPSAVDELKREVNVFRFYFALSASSELFNAAQSAYAQISSH